MKFKRNSFVQTVVAMIVAVVAAVAAAVVAVDVIILVVVVVAVVGRSQSVGDSFAVETVGQTMIQ